MLPRQQDQEGRDIPFSLEEQSLTAELYQRYASKLFFYIRQHIPIDDAEDVLLEVFLTVFEHEIDLENMLEDEQRAWLWTVARNRVTDYYRRISRRRFVPLEHVTAVVEDSGTPEQIALRREEQRNLSSYLEQLPVAQQEVLQLRFTSGLRCTEIATVLNKREGTVRTMLSRALNTLRNSYKR